jgi:glycosyltransferase involved in cell wall biosynthesis
MDEVRPTAGPAGGAEPRLHGVLITFRRPHALMAILRRLEEQARRLDRLVVVDNAPSDAAEAMVADHPGAAAEIRYVGAPENLGPAGGIALGMRTVLEEGADEDWVVLLDDDDPPEGDEALERLERFAHERLEADPRTAAVGLTGARFDWRRGRPVRMPDRDLSGAVAVDYVGGNQLPTYRLAVLREVGTFRDDLFFGFDDLEFGLRLRAAGYSLYVDGDRWLERRSAKGRMGLDGGPSVGLGPVSWRRYYSLRNVVWILRSHGRSGTAARLAVSAGVGKPLLHLVRTPGLALAHLRQGLRASVDGWAGKMGRTLEPEVEARSSEVRARG